MAASGNLTLVGVSLIGGDVQAAAGGINNAGTLHVKSSIIERNLGDPGAGIYNTGVLAITDSTIRNERSVQRLE